MAMQLMQYLMIMKKRCFMFMDYITYQGVTQDVAEQKMLQELEHLFWKSHSSLEKVGFPTPGGVPIELEEAISVWMQPDVLLDIYLVLGG
jgi:hypothetical protein